MCGHECMADETCEHLERCLAQSGVSSIEEVRQINKRLRSGSKESGERKEADAV